MILKFELSYDRSYWWYGRDDRWFFDVPKDPLEAVRNEHRKIYAEILIISPANYPHSETFREVAEGLKEGFAELGYIAPITTTPTPGTKTIVLGANIDQRGIPDDAIIFNLEQYGSPWLRPGRYLDLLTRQKTWDYSASNLGTFRALGIEVQYCPIGYANTLTRIPEQGHDIDVLFFGSIFGRREPILKAVEATGLNCKWLFGVYGRERDEWIARSKIVLNIHAYSADGPLETVRLSYLLANKKFVISEPSDELLPGVAWWKASKIPWACEFFAKETLTRRAIAQRGFEAFSKVHQSEYLRPLITSGQSAP